MMVGLFIGLVPACGDDAEDDTGSAECCKVRKICDSCLCSDAQETAGLDDKKRPCELVLEDWEGIGCIACQNSNCLSGC